MSKIKSEEYLHKLLISDVTSMSEEDLDVEFKALNVDVDNELGKINSMLEQQSLEPVSYTHLTLPTKRIV